MQIRQKLEKKKKKKCPKTAGAGLKFYNPRVLLSYLFYFKPLTGLYCYMLGKAARANMEAATQHRSQ